MLSRRSAIFALVFGVAALLTPALAGATEAANLKLPPNPYGCGACHGSPAVSPTSVPPIAVTPFTELGLQWLSQSNQEAARLWSELALGNVDGDGCSNGFELGDPSGTFLPDGPPVADQSVSDPNEQDCTLPISADSWSRLKSLFDGS